MMRQPESPRWMVYGLAAFSGLLLTLSFPRFDWAPLAWFALVPLFFAIHGQTPARAARAGLMTGGVFYLLSLKWVIRTLVDYGGIPPGLSWLILGLLAGYLSLYLGLFAYLMVRLGRGNPVFSFFLAPLLWTGLEYLRSIHAIYGFSWQGLGYSQYSQLPFIQIAEITGVYGVSALIVLVNAGLYSISHPAFSSPQYRSRWRWPVAWITVAVLAGAWGYGQVRINGLAPDGPGLKVALIQGNIPQHLKWDPAYRAEVLKRYSSLTARAAKQNPQLIVWPEAVTPFYFENDAAGGRAVKQVAQSHHIPLLFGSPYLAPPPEAEPGPGGAVLPARLFNSAYYLDSGGRVRGRYDKIHLVPFGEFVPLRSLLFFVDKLVVGMADFSRGDSYDVFDLDGVRFGVSICFEITLPDLVRRPVKAGAQFLVNITNDAWFGKSAASYQHISMAALRAVENRVPIVRAANTGITGFISRRGEIRQASELFTEAVVVGDIFPASGERTFYSLYGDVFSWLCLSLTVILGFLARLSHPASVMPSHIPL
ncbi:MAG: apolipoprotein N-acyltransferase [Nitrospinaceae bacterium]